MFSSLASFIFGSNTSATTNSETNPPESIGQEREQNPNQNPQSQQLHQRQQQRPRRQPTNEGDLLRIEAENTIHVTSSTPSVTGCQNNESISLRGPINQGGKRNNGKSKRNKNSRNKRQQAGEKATPSLAKLLTPNESCDEDLDENEWFIVEKEDEETSLPRTDSEEELSVVDVKPAVQPVAGTSGSANLPTSGRHRQHINSHSLYSGPRPQQQRNFIQRARNSGRNSASLNASTLGPQGRSIIDAGINAGLVASPGSAAADADCVTQSLYVARPQLSSAVTAAFSLASCVNGNDGGANIGMEESWFVTPPPCFTSIGPINMETSPYENLLIEHPSMSVYHSIRSAQEAAESFVNLDLGVVESPETQRPADAAAVSAMAVVEAANTAGRIVQTTGVQQARNAGVRGDRFSSAQLKQEMLARSTQKGHDMRERQYLCRGAIKRSNKVRDFQSKANRQRRSDMQHCKIISGANNNRKCCF